MVDFSLFLLVPSGVFRRDDIVYARSDAESTSLLVPNLDCRDLQSNSESWLHNPPIRVQSNGLSAGWSSYHTTTLIIRSCTLNGESLQLYSFRES